MNTPVRRVNGFNDGVAQWLVADGRRAYDVCIDSRGCTPTHPGSLIR